jgi:predicted nucleic acid-binding protein
VSSLPYSKPYIESSVFIAFIKGEKTQGPNRDMDAEAIFASIIAAAMEGQFKIHTSSLTIAEVHKKKNCPELSDGECADLTPYFREEFITLVEVDREIGETANHLCRTHKAGLGQKALRPNDAIHIASAMKAGSDVLLTWDPDLLSQTVDGLRIECPIDLTGIPFSLKAEQ